MTLEARLQLRLPRITEGSQRATHPSTLGIAVWRHRGSIEFRNSPSRPPSWLLSELNNEVVVEEFHHILSIRRLCHRSRLVRLQPALYKCGCQVCCHGPGVAATCQPLLDGSEFWWAGRESIPQKPSRRFYRLVGREGFEPPQLSRVVYSHLSSPMPSRPRAPDLTRPERA